MQYKCSAFGVAVRVNNVCGAWNGGSGDISSMATWRLMDVLMDGKTAVLQDAEFFLAIFRKAHQTAFYRVLARTNALWASWTILWWMKAML